MPKLYIIAGCNGAGKTTASYTVLPEMLECREFVNADEIAKGLSPFNPEKVSFQAGKLMLQRMRELLDEGADFAFETTLSTRSYAEFVQQAQQRGYFVSLLFFWLPTPEQAISRVAMRVKAGGHDIPQDVIRRRYARGLHNLTSIFMPLCDFWAIYDNGSADYIVKTIATGGRMTDTDIHDPSAYRKIVDYERTGDTANAG